MELDAIYKAGNMTSHEEGLRLVYEKGRYDATPRITDVLPPLPSVDTSVVFDPTTAEVVATEQVEQPSDNTHTEQSSIVPNQEVGS